MTEENIQVVFTDFCASSGFGRVVARKDGDVWDVVLQKRRDGEWVDKEVLGYTPNVGVELPAEIQTTKS